MTPEKFFDFPTTKEADSASSYQPKRNTAAASRLGQLPKLSERKSFKLTATSLCAGCAGKLDPLDQVQESIRACRKCLQVYANLDTAFDKKAERDKQELLENFVAEVKGE